MIYWYNSVAMGTAADAVTIETTFDRNYGDDNTATTAMYRG